MYIGMAWNVVKLYGHQGWIVYDFFQNALRNAVFGVRVLYCLDGIKTVS